MIFRWGVSCLTELHESASEIVETYWKDSRVEFLEFLDSPYGEILQGLFKPFMQYFDSRHAGPGDSFRDFRSLDEVEKTKRALLQLKKIHEFLHKLFPDLFQAFIRQINQEDFEASLFSLLGTCFAHFITQGNRAAAPLSEDEFQLFLERAFEKKGANRVLSGEWKDKFLRGSFSRNEQELLLPLWALVFERLEEELSKLDLSKAIDRRFIASLWLQTIQERKARHAPSRS